MPARRRVLQLTQLLDDAHVAQHDQHAASDSDQHAWRNAEADEFENAHPASPAKRCAHLADAAQHLGRNETRKDWQQDFWWTPGTGMPDRGPSFEEVAGR